MVIAKGMLRVCSLNQVESVGRESEETENILSTRK